MNEQNVGTEGATAGSKERAASGISAKSHEAAEQLKSAVVDQAEHARHMADSARDDAAERFRRVASHLRSVGDTLRSDDHMASMLAERASRGVEGVADYVASKDVRGFLRDTEQLARRQPALFFGSAFVLGLAIGRFLKSSPPEQGTSSRTSDEDDRPRTGVPSQPKDSPSPAGTSQQRFRENYDAAFGRDIASAPAEASSKAAGGGPGSAKPNPAVPNGERSPESNGGRRSGKGKVS
jgi:hypothetical protein